MVLALGARPMGTGIGGTHARERRTTPMPTAQPRIDFRCSSVLDLKPGRALTFEHYAVRFAGRPFILAKYAVGRLGDCERDFMFARSQFHKRAFVFPFEQYVDPVRLIAENGNVVVEFVREFDTTQELDCSHKLVLTALLHG